MVSWENIYACRDLRVTKVPEFARGFENFTESRTNSRIIEKKVTSRPCFLLRIGNNNNAVSRRIGLMFKMLQ